MYTYKKIKSSEVDSMRKRILKTFIAPVDDMWEHGIIGNGDFYLIYDKEAIGYFVVNAENVLLQYYINDDCLDKYIYVFNKLIVDNEIKNAYASTYEPNFLSVCLRNSISSEVNTYLYKEVAIKSISTPFDFIYSELANQDQFSEIYEYHKEKVGLKGEFLENYLTSLISNNGLFIYRLNDEIVGTGEMRPSTSFSSYANLGITVSKHFRNRKIGAYILNQMRIKSNSEGYKSICSTTKENISSQMMIRNSGYIDYHRILTIKLK